MAGYVITATDVNNQVGRLVTSLWNALDDVRQFKLWLDDSSHDNAFLTSIGLSNASDQTLIRNSFADLGGAGPGLWAVAHGTFAPGGASNYFSNAKLLSGLNYTG